MVRVGRDGGMDLLCSTIDGVGITNTSSLSKNILGPCLVASIVPSPTPNPSPKLRTVFIGAIV